MGKQFSVFVVRWLLNSFGLWVAVRLLGTTYQSSSWEQTSVMFVVAGLIFSIINSILKPLIVILSLPAILLTLGLFMLIVNGLMVYISFALAPGLSISFGSAILAGILMSLVNYIVSAALELRSTKEA
jgi:putative membrane protein